MSPHTPEIEKNLAAVGSGNTELEICSPQYPIEYHSCTIYCCKWLQHDLESSWNLVMVGTLKIRLRLPYRPTSWLRPLFISSLTPYAIVHPPHTAIHMPSALPLRLPDFFNSANFRIKSIHGSIKSSEIGMVFLLESVLGSVEPCRMRMYHQRAFRSIRDSVLSSVLRSVLRVYLGASWELRWECKSSRLGVWHWEHLGAYN